MTPAYRPLDESLGSPTIRLLRCLSRFDAITCGDILLAVGAPVDRKEPEYVSLSRTLYRLADRGLANTSGRRNERVFTISEAGRAALEQGMRVAGELSLAQDLVRKRKRNGSGAGRTTPQMLAALRERYAQRKADHLCVSCGAGLELDDARVRCVECRESTNRTTNSWNRRHRQRVAELARIRYAKNPERARSANRQRYSDLKVLGLCVSCAEPSREDCNLCQQCTERGAIRQKRYQQKRLAERRASGLCSCCSQPRIPGRTKCQRHLDLYKASNQAYRARIKRARSVTNAKDCVHVRTKAD